MFRPSSAIGQNRSMSRSLDSIIKSGYGDSQIYLELNTVPLEPSQAPVEGMGMMELRAPAFFNSEVQARASQLRAGGMVSASYMGGLHERRRVSDPQGATVALSLRLAGRDMHLCGLMNCRCCVVRIAKFMVSIHCGIIASSTLC